MTADDIKRALAAMGEDKKLITKPNYLGRHPDVKLLSFEEWHLAYLELHPKVDATNYLTNLRVMIRARSAR